MVQIFCLSSIAILQGTDTSVKMTQHNTVLLYISSYQPNLITFQLPHWVLEKCFTELREVGIRCKKMYCCVRYPWDTSCLPGQSGYSQTLMLFPAITAVEFIFSFNLIYHYSTHDPLAFSPGLYKCSTYSGITKLFWGVSKSVADLSTTLCAFDINPSQQSSFVFYDRCTLLFHVHKS